MLIEHESYTLASPQASPCAANPLPVLKLGLSSSHKACAVAVNNTESTVELAILLTLSLSQPSLLSYAMLLGRRD